MSCGASTESKAGSRPLGGTSVGTSASLQSRDVTIRSADRRLHAIGTSCRTASRSRARTSASCACDASASQKNTTRSSSRFAIIAPTCASPPRGPLSSARTGSPIAPDTSFAVCRVPQSSASRRRTRFQTAYSTMSRFWPSCAMSAMRMRAITVRGCDRRSRPLKVRTCPLSEPGEHRLGTASRHRRHCALRAPSLRSTHVPILLLTALGAAIG
jgi:hypothetical protein